MLFFSAVLSTIGNGLSLYNFLKRKRSLRKPMNILLFNLVLTDFGFRYVLKNCRIITQYAHTICTTFIQCRPNVFDVGPTLYKCGRNGLRLPGSCPSRCRNNWFVHRLRRWSIKQTTDEHIRMVLVVI